MFTSRRCSRSRPPSIVLLGTILAVVPFVSASPAWACAPQGPGAVPLSQGISELASQLAKAIPQGQQMTIAVTDFPDLGGQTCQIGRYVAERLSTLMSQHPQCRLIERRRLDMVLQELKFSMSELVDPTKAKKLGQMLGVQGLVIGTLSDMGSTIDVDARIVDIQTDMSLPGASVSVVRDEAARALSSACSGGEPAMGAAAAKPPAPARRETHKAVVKDFTFEVKLCSLKGAKLTCSMTITDDGPDTTLMVYVGKWYGPDAPRVIDNSGNEYAADLVQMGNNSGSSNAGVREAFASGVPTAASFTFEDFSPTADTISLLEIPVDSGGGRFRAQIRNIPVTK